MSVSRSTVYTRLKNKGVEPASTPLLHLTRHVSMRIAAASKRTRIGAADPAGDQPQADEPSGPPTQRAKLLERQHEEQPSADLSDSESQESQASTQAPFAGLTISISGCSPSEKARLAALIQAAGGRHSADLTRRCTHLVCKVAGSAKHRFALKERLLVVTPAWVDASAASERRLDETQFALEATRQHLHQMPSVLGQHLHQTRSVLNAWPVHSLMLPFAYQAEPQAQGQTGILGQHSSLTGYTA
ncbi:hypothetical protein WJX72_009859 [[Myrmecia] bisecta]|uniref:BRCT domain-containing protein n=1 Tax=[Myrmecia] bisecta TaxID=41462 RepID=A0AAW1QSI9_9CHLO